MIRKKVTFIGLGVMGYPMAGHLKKNNIEVTVYNRTSSKSDKWVSEYGGFSESTPGKASQNSEIIFICVGKDSDLREVMEGEEGILKNVRENTIIVDHTTASANIAREYFEICKNHNLHFLDAPVSGGQAGAENGKLSTPVKTLALVPFAPVVKEYSPPVRDISSFIPLYPGSSRFK